MLGIEGLIAATFTPFRADGNLALDRVGPMVDGLVRRGIAGLFVAGSTGEGVSLTSSERREVAAEFVKSAGGRVPVIVHVGHNSVPEAAGLARHAAEIGASAISAAPPSYFPLSSIEQARACIEPVAAAAPRLPFYYYHIPERSGVALDIARLLEHIESIPSFGGVKFTSPEIDHFQAARKVAGNRYELMFGCDEMLLSALAVGARAAVGSTYNFASGLYHQILADFEKGDFAEAARWQEQSVALVRIISRWGGLSAQKALMAAVGCDCGRPRTPLRSLSDEEVRRMMGELEALGLGEVLDEWE